MNPPPKGGVSVEDYFGNEIPDQLVISEFSSTGLEPLRMEADDGQ